MSPPTSTSQQSVQEIIDLYTEYGTSDYIGESVTQLQHSIEAAYHAQRAKQNEIVIISSLLHDIGHLYGMKHKSKHMSDLGILSHESVGAQYLRTLHMNTTVCELVEQHVNAKRYLCYKNSQYYNKLSDASKHTLQYQGGAMTAAEATQFENNKLFDTILLMRTFDEAAKSNKPVPSIESYRLMMEQLIDVQ